MLNRQEERDTTLTDINTTNVGEAISVPPFVDDEEQVSDDSVVEPSSEEGTEALAKDFQSDLSDKIDQLTNKINDLMTLNKVDKLIDALNDAFDEPEDKSDSVHSGHAPSHAPAAPDMQVSMQDIPDEVEDDSSSDVKEDNNTEKEAAMATVKKRATDEDDTVDAPMTAEEVLDNVTDQGTMFDQAQDEAADESTVPGSAEVGDNYAGSTETMSDTEDLKPVTTSAAMRLADAYIKAGVLSEDARYDAVDKFASTLTRTAARNQLKALTLVKKANDRKAAALRKAAMRRKTADNEVTITTDPGFSATVTPQDDGTANALIDGQEQTFDSMEDALSYVSNESGLDLSTGNTDDKKDEAVAARRAAARKAAARKAAARRAAARKAAVRKAAVRKAIQKAAVQRAAVNRNSMHRAALASARKAAARTPRVATRTSTASTDASMALI